MTDKTPNMMDEMRVVSKANRDHHVPLLTDTVCHLSIIALGHRLYTALVNLARAFSRDISARLNIA